MKTAKAHVLMFDLECPECGGLCESPEGGGSLSWSIHEGTPKTAKCFECEIELKIPGKIPGAKIAREVWK